MIGLLFAQLDKHQLSKVATMMMQLTATLVLACVMVLLMTPSVTSMTTQQTIEHLSDTVQRLEQERDRIRSTSELEISALRATIHDLSEQLERTTDKLDSAQREAAHAMKEVNRYSADSDALHRHVAAVTRRSQECAMRENAIATELSRCEALRTDLEMDAMHLRRSHDLVQSEVRQLHARDEAMLALQQENDRNIKRWKEIEISHKQQVNDFHKDVDAGEFHAEEEDPHPEVDTPRYFSQLKAQEEAYKAEMYRRKELERVATAEPDL